MEIEPTKISLSQTLPHCTTMLQLLITTKYLIDLCLILILLYDIFYKWTDIHILLHMSRCKTLLLMINDFDSTEVFYFKTTHIRRVPIGSYFSNGSRILKIINDEAVSRRCKEF